MQRSINNNFFDEVCTLISERDPNVQAQWKMTANTNTARFAVWPKSEALGTLCRIVFEKDLALPDSKTIELKFGQQFVWCAHVSPDFEETHEQALWIATWLYAQQQGGVSNEDDGFLNDDLRQTLEFTSPSDDASPPKHSE